MRPLSRTANRAWAAAFGYFWLACPICGEEFGGHEWRDYGGRASHIPHESGQPGLSTGICPDCTRAGFGYDPNIPSETTEETP